SKTAVQEALAAALKLLDFRLRKQDIQLQMALDPDLPPVFVEKGEPQQVFLNILTNAMDAMPQGGKLTVNGYREGSYLVVAVADEGPGIDPEALRKVFDPFYTTKEPGRGTGMGLPISYSIMQRLGGRIELESSRQGTTVRLYYPIIEGGQQGTEDIGG
ncbi:MAG: sensor histidine kinase, partial [Clostridia bacterium]|nr:sensor histidine kinase [Clostridia bacterium]